MTATSLPDLEAHLGYWLRRVSNHVSGEFARSLQSRNISVAEWVALRHLYDWQDVTPGELAQFMGVTRGAVSKVLDKLEGKGWLTHETKPEDHRVQVLSLTLAGTRLLPELAEMADANDKKHFDCLSHEERNALKTLLQKLTEVHQWRDVPVE